MRVPIERTSIITIEMYALLFDCCESYYDYISWKFPEQCPDGRGVCGIDMEKLNNYLSFEIPTLFRAYNKIAKPYKKNSGFSQDDEDFDQYALLDFVEFVGQNLNDIKKRISHSYFGHDDMIFSKTSDIFYDYHSEINDIFKKTGLLYTITENKIVERVVENSVLSAEVENALNSVKEQGTKELLEEAVAMFKHPNPAARKIAVEKLWDAFERLKTYYTTLDKKASAAKIVNDMSGGHVDFINLFNDEFKALTDIGNGYRIRHHETNKIDITDVRHYDYFFNRCLSLISTAINYLS